MNANGNRRSTWRFVFSLALLSALAFASRTQAQQQTPTTPTTPSGNARQPVVTNQFNTVVGGSLQQRRPGLYVQQGVAVHSGNNAFFDGSYVDERSFIGQTVRDIFTTILDTINTALDAINGPFGGSSPLSGLTSLLGQTGTTTMATQSARFITSAPSDIVPAP